MKRRTLWPLIAIGLAVWALAGCSDTPSTPAADDELLTREQSVDLDDPFGGFNLADEEPAFGDPALVSDYGLDGSAGFDDPMENDPEVRRIRERHRLHRYLMITWGNLEADSTIDFVTDWSGALSVDNGVVLVARTIRFEPTDEILPRTSRDTVEWVSYTRPHFDGIIVALHKALRCDSTASDSSRASHDWTEVTEPLAVTFRTGPLTVTITGDDLADLHRVVTVDDAGNAVAFNTITVMPEECPSGFMAGQWKDANDRPGGIFRGKWMSRNGAHMGYLRGVYGPNSRGEKVFFGKWITAAGRFEGLLRGHYDPAGDRPGGTFEGDWIGRERRVMGGLRGVYGKHENNDGLHTGFFQARWQARVCR